MPIKSLSDEELKKIADGIYKGEIFTSNQLNHPEDIGTVFMSLLFLDDTQISEIRDEVGMVYEYMSNALPRSINGMPCFTSVHLLNQEDTKKVNEYFKKITEAVNNIH